MNNSITFKFERDVLMFLKTGTPKTINFPFGTNGKLMVLGVPILKHIRVYTDYIISFEKINI